MELNQVVSYKTIINNGITLEWWQTHGQAKSN